MKPYQAIKSANKIKKIFIIQKNHLTAYSYERLIEDNTKLTRNKKSPVENNNPFIIDIFLLKKKVPTNVKTKAMDINPV